MRTVEVWECKDCHHTHYANILKALQGMKAICPECGEGELEYGGETEVEDE